jgi:hypothetical protein
MVGLILLKKRPKNARKKWILYQKSELDDKRTFALLYEMRRVGFLHLQITFEIRCLYYGVLKKFIAERAGQVLNLVHEVLKKFTIIPSGA